MARVSAAVGRRVSDRTVRAALEELRAAAHPVVSSSAASGYWLSDDQAEIQECIDRTYLSRIRHHAAAARGLRRAASVVASAPEQQGRLLG